MPYKLIAFDLDGTLTQHRTPLEEKNRSVLERLAKKYQLLMVGAGACLRIFGQMDGFPIDVIGNYGMQVSRYNPETKTLDIIEDAHCEPDREHALRECDALRKKYGYTDYAGEAVEFHASGMITFPLLGTKAKIEDKLAFDPDRRKRKVMYDDVVAAFPGCTVFIGGSSSFDIAPYPYNKYYALDQYCKAHGLTHDEVAYVGDDYGIGGNDEQLYHSDIRFFTVDDYRKLEDALAELLD